MVLFLETKLGAVTMPGAHHDGLCKGQDHIGITKALGPSSESDLGSRSSPPSSVPEDSRFLRLLLLSWLVTGANGDISKELRDTVSTPLIVRAWEKMEGRVFRSWRSLE